MPCLQNNDLEEMLMKQLGNLAMVCARRPETLMQLHDGRVTVYVGAGSERTALSTAWDNDAEINDIIRMP